MQIKRFEARDMAEALKMIKREFGPQAVILSARDITKGKGVLGLLRGPGVEVTAATDANNGIAKSGTQPLSSRKWTLLKDSPYGPGPESRPGISPSHRLRLEKRDQVKRPASPAGRGRSDAPRDDNLVRFLNLYEELLGQGVEESIASTLIERLREKTSERGLAEGEVGLLVTDALKGMGVSDGVDPVGRGRRRAIALVGQAGVGKTATLVKIAAREAFQEGREVAIVTLDDHRIGAVAQMEAYGKILDVPVAAASNPGEVKEALKRFGDKDLVLVDTPGISPNDIYGITELKGLLDAFGPLEIHLLVSAGTRRKDFDGILDKFGVLPIAYLLFTKIDETAEYGPILNALVRTGLRVSYLTNGPEIPENIEEGSIARLIEMLCTGRKGRVREGREGTENSPFDADRRLERGPSTERYVANRSSDLFHLPSCKWVERIDKRNMVVFETCAEALAHHFRPCRACQPLRRAADDGQLSEAGPGRGMREIAAC